MILGYKRYRSMHRDVHLKVLEAHKTKFKYGVRVSPTVFSRGANWIYYNDAYRDGVGFRLLVMSRIGP